MADEMKTITATLMDESLELGLDELCRACAIDTEHLLALVAEGIIEPCRQTGDHWRFPATSLIRIQTTLRLQRDLGVNLAGAALALQLLEQNRRLRERLRVLERLLD